MASINSNGVNLDFSNPKYTSTGHWSGSAYGPPSSCKVGSMFVNQVQTSNFMVTWPTVYFPGGTYDKVNANFSVSWGLSGGGQANGNTGLFIRRA